ncbi:hypothetical protein DAI22_05g010550 [Oryza sativa Japonica Group]|nr:hypothetical protein DAI22_05g010550 [Oryza sativa Japonica Group]
MAAINHETGVSYSLATMIQKYRAPQHKLAVGNDNYIKKISLERIWNQSRWNHGKSIPWKTNNQLNLMNSKMVGA